MGVERKTYNQKLQHVHIGAEKRNLDLLGDFMNSASKSAEIIMSTPTSGIMNAVRSMSSNGMQQDYTTTIPSSLTGGVMGAFSVLGMAATQANAANGFMNTYNFSTQNPSVITNSLSATSKIDQYKELEKQMAIAHGAFLEKKSDVASNALSFSQNSLKTLSSYGNRSLLMTPGLESEKIQIKNTKDYLNFKSEIMQIGRSNGLGNVLKDGNGILTQQQNRLTEQQDRLNFLTQNGKKTAFTDKEKREIEEIKKAIGLTNQNIAICHSGIALANNEKKYGNPNGKHIGRFSATVGVFSKINSSVVRAASNTDTYQGYQTLRQYANYTKLMTKLSLRTFGVGYKFVGKPTGKLAGKGLNFFAQKIGNKTFIKAVNVTTKGVAAVAGIGEIGGNLLLNQSKELKEAISEKTKRTIGSGAKVVGRGAKTVGVKALNVIAKNRIGRGAIWIGKGMGKVGKVGFGVLSLPFKGVSFAFRKFTLLKKLITDPLAAGMDLLKKIGFGFLAVNIVPAIIVAFVVLVVGSLGVVGEAVSKTYEKFISESTMGGAYKKLLDKERDFASAVSSLKNEPVPKDIGHGITTWTNFNVHIIGADGKEMPSTLESTAGGTAIGTGYSNGGYGTLRNATSDQIWTYMKKNGWTDQATAALMGNIYNECSMNHRANGRQDIGIVQWTDNSKGSRRKTDYITWAKSNGYDPLELQPQLEYLFKEPYHGNTVRAMANKTNIEEATWYFIANYERYNNYKTDMKEKNERIAAAKDYYNFYTTDPNFNNIEVDDSLVAQNQGQVAGQSGIANVDSTASGYGISTIKGILSMAYIYIDRDFKKYGGLLDNQFGDSTYKDYVAKLYDSTHIIAIDENPPKVYYDPAYGPDAPEPEYHIAGPSCNNSIPAGITKGSTDTSEDRDTAITITQEEAEYQYEKENKQTGNSETKTVTYTKTNVYGVGACGTVEYEYYKDDGANAAVDAYRNALKTMKGRGSQDYESYITYQDEDVTRCVLVSNDPVCRGHIDGNAYVFISNIYDPSYENFSDKSASTTTEQSDDSQLVSEAHNSNNNSSTSLLALNKNSLFGITAFAYPDDEDEEPDDVETIDEETTESSKPKQKTELDFNVDGWQRLGDNWYYIENGEKIANKRKVIEKHETNESTGKTEKKYYYYFFDQDGKMITGFREFQNGNGKKFKRYFGTDGAMKFGWTEINGKWYYFAEKNQGGYQHGQMYSNEKTPDGYKVGVDGVWKDEKETTTSSANTGTTGSGNNANGNSNSNTNVNNNTNNNANNNANSNNNNSSGNNSGGTNNFSNGDGSSNYDEEKAKKQDEEMKQNQESKHKYSEKALDYVEKKQKESKFSMYALDKYATAFNDPKEPNEKPENVYMYNTGVSTDKVKINGRLGDEESVNEANQHSDDHDGEKYVMEELVKTFTNSDNVNIRIKSWWKNDGWWESNISTRKTYYRIYNGDTNMDELKRPSSSNKDRNVVNSSNSKAFWFNSFTTREGRNENFEKHGWDDSSITQVRLILANDWETLYGVQIKNTLNIEPLTDAEISAMLENETSLINLSEVRKNILKTAYSFQENVAKRFNTPYVFGGGHTIWVSPISTMTSRNVFDCSSYTSTIYGNANLDMGIHSTADYRSSNLYRKIDARDILPGDLIVTDHHVVLYLGNGRIAHASHTGTLLKDTFNVEGTRYLKTGKVIRYYSLPDN